jgi:hypothetical protein
MSTRAEILRETKEHHGQTGEDAYQASLVGLVRALLERASER